MPSSPAYQQCFLLFSAFVPTYLFLSPIRIPPLPHVIFLPRFCFFFCLSCFSCPHPFLSPMLPPILSLTSYLITHLLFSLPFSSYLVIFPPVLSLPPCLAICLSLLLSHLPFLRTFPLRLCLFTYVALLPFISTLTFLNIPPYRLSRLYISFLSLISPPPSLPFLASFILYSQLPIPFLLVCSLCTCPLPSPLFVFFSFPASLIFTHIHLPLFSSSLPVSVSLLTLLASYPLHLLLLPSPPAQAILSSPRPCWWVGTESLPVYGGLLATEH